jgi:hypothetical protein
VSILHPGDHQMHYSDGSHRWIAPDGILQLAWEAGLKVHQAAHMATMGGSIPAEAPQKPVPRLLPRYDTGGR